MWWERMSRKQKQHGQWRGGKVSVAGYHGEMEVVHDGRKVGQRRVGLVSGTRTSCATDCWWQPRLYVRSSHWAPSQMSNGRHAASTQVSSSIQAKSIQNRTFHFLRGSDFFPPILFISVRGNLYPQLMKLKIKKSSSLSIFFTQAQIQNKFQICLSPLPPWLLLYSKPLKF